MRHARKMANQAAENFDAFLMVLAGILIWMVLLSMAMWYQDMKARNILLPVDVTACHLEVFPFVNQYAREESVTVALLHVSRLNVVAPENRLYTEIEQEARTVLSRLQRKFINPRLDTRICVRFGRPTREIVAEATALSSDLIILARHSDRRRWRWFQTDIVEKVIVTAPCPVRVVRVNGRSECVTKWSLTDEELAATNPAPTFPNPQVRPELMPSYAQIQG